MLEKHEEGLVLALVMVVTTLTALSHCQSSTSKVPENAFRDILAQGCRAVRDFRVEQMRGERWQVLGGADTGGVLVRSGRSLTSEQLAELPSKFLRQSA